MAFSKMEQAERMYEKLRTWAMDFEISGDWKKAEQLESQAERLWQAIMAVKYRQATKEDLAIFNRAVAMRTELDLQREIIDIIQT